MTFCVCVFDAQNELAEYVIVTSNFSSEVRSGRNEYWCGRRQTGADGVGHIIQNLTATVNLVASTYNEPAVSNSFQTVQPFLQDIQQQLLDANTMINQRLVHLNTICSKLAETTAVIAN